MLEVGHMKPGRAVFLLSLVALATLAVRHALTSPLGHDDIEHLHTAWLVSQGYRPFLDFFQKQSPFFWLLLQPAALLAQGDLLAYALLGRLTMLAALAATAVGIGFLARSVSRSPTLAMAAPFLLLGSPTLLYNLIAIRPDGIMVAAVVWGVVMLGWSMSGARQGARRTGLLVASGFLLGLAAVLLLKAAPSAVVLSLAAGVLAALGFTGSSAGTSNVKPPIGEVFWRASRDIALLAAGGVLAVLPFLAWLHLAGLLDGFWFTNVVFNGWLYSSPMAEDVPRASRLGTILLAMLRNEPWLPGSAVLAFLLVPRRIRFLKAPERVVLALLLLLVTNLLLLIPNHLPFYSYFLLPLLAGIALAPALLERLLDRFEHHRIEWRTPRTIRGFKVPTALVAVLALAVLAAGITGYQRFSSSEGQIRKLAALPRDRETYELPDHPVFIVDRHYVWDNVDRYVETLRRMDRAGALPDWVRRRCAEQFQYHGTAFVLTGGSARD